MIVTFDSTILVRATKRSHGPAREVLDAIALNPDHIVALSPYILGEVGKVLSYPRMQTLYRLSADVDPRARRVSEGDLTHRGAGSGDASCASDPGDDEVIYTAAAAGADILCTRDRDFYDPRVLRFCAEQGIWLMDDLDLLKTLRSRPPKF